MNVYKTALMIISAYGYLMLSRNDRTVIINSDVSTSFAFLYLCFNMYIILFVLFLLWVRIWG